MVESLASRAVMYVRMSTESQDYSTDHQRAKICEYATARSISIIREYVDDGKSGLDIKGRAGLLALMQDVQAAKPDFSKILVYDVSRWGRFQDIDEAAYHEHTCRRAGIEVVYCEEKFGNDSGPYASLLKSMKRVMAAEYSRELSEKVFSAQVRFVEMGFKQGGHAGYGLRRLALKACGTPRAILELGEAKISATDRVILIWGPDNEVETVRRIHHLYLNEVMSEAGLAKLLNKEQVLSEFGRPWTAAMINSVLTNTKYCGALAYNRRSCKLSHPRTCNSRDQWVVNSNAIPPIISLETFDRVQAERARRQRRFGREELLTLLQECHQRHGKVNAPIIAADPSMPDPQLFVRKFGSLIKAYDAAGLPRALSYAFVDTKRILATKRDELLREVTNLAETAGATVDLTPARYLITLNGTVTVKVDVVPPRRPRRGLQNWRVAAHLGADFSLVGRFDPCTQAIYDYFLMPAVELSANPIYLKVSNIDRYAHLRYARLAGIFGLAEA